MKWLGCSTHEMVNACTIFAVIPEWKRPLGGDKPQR